MSMLHAVAQSPLPLSSFRGPLLSHLCYFVNVTTRQQNQKFITNGCSAFKCSTWVCLQLFCAIVAQADCCVVFVLSVLPRPHFQIHRLPYFWCVVNVSSRTKSSARETQDVIDSPACLRSSLVVLPRGGASNTFFWFWMSSPLKPSLAQFETHEGVPRNVLRCTQAPCREDVTHL